MSLRKAGNHIPPMDDEIEEAAAPIPDGRRVALFYQTGKHLPTVAHAKGLYLWDTDGKRYLDGCSGAFAANLGHGDEHVIRRAKEQLDKVAFAYRTQFENEPANQLANLLAALSPPELNRVFLVNSGSEAVETAIKLARQYWWSLGQGGKHFIIARRPSYHGATLGALSCSDYAPLNIPFRPMLLPFQKVAAPYCYHCPLEKEYPSCNLACAYELERLIQVIDPGNVAAFIAEPIGGASTGAAVPPDEYFPIVERICNENNILLIIDDVLTGCGRTGRFYGFQHWDVVPDIVALSKGLSGGYTPIGAVVASDDIVRPVIDSGGFQHGHTYAGNPLSAAIAAEVVRQTVDRGLIVNAAETGVYLHQCLRELKARYDIIGDVRGRGLLAGIEFVCDRRNREPFPSHWFVALAATEIARNHGLIIYPRRSVSGLTGDHVLIAPPLTIDRSGVDELIDLFDATLSDLTGHLQQFIDKQAAASEDGTFERYVPPAGAEEARESLEKFKEDPNANVTWTMQSDELEVAPVEPTGASQPPRRRSSRPPSRPSKPSRDDEE